MAEDLPGDNPKEKKDYHNRPRYKSDSDHVMKKRVPPRSAKKSNDFYVTNKSDFKGQLGRCLKLLEDGEEEIFVHASGAAVSRAINLTLQLRDKSDGSFLLQVRTSTLKLVDDWLPVNDGADAFTRERSNSAVRIRVYKKL